MTKKLAHLVALTAAFGLTACPADDDGDTTNASNVTTASTSVSTTESMETGSESESGGNMTASTTEPMEESSTAPSDSSSEGGDACEPTDECSVDADCAGGGMCISCLCVGGEETGGACTPGACDGCGDANMCVACGQMMGGECETENVACNMNAECNALIMCSNDCGMDQACAEGCVDMHADGVADFQALLGCLQMLCS